jgi:pimeloyl-ACP methyl ester carboxylesterase
MINRLVAGFAAVLTLFALALASDTQHFLRVDANGPQLRMQVMGSGEPTVVFENGGGGSIELWGFVPARVSEFTRVVAYDRAGDGMSDEGTGPRVGRTIAAELHAALENAAVTPPYILVGHSLGGPYVRIFASMYPEEVSGLVLIDPTQEGMIEWNDKHGFTRPSDRPDWLSATLDQARESKVPPNIPVYLIHVMYPWVQGPFRSREMDDVIARNQSRVPMRLQFHKEWLEGIPGGKLVNTNVSSHGGINFEEPALVINTIRQAVGRVVSQRKN